MTTKTTFTTTLAALLVAGGVAATSAAAAPISGSTGESGLGRFTGTLTYSASSNTLATLTVALTNTSPVANGGFLTAFALNNPGNLITTISGFTDAPGGGMFSLIALTNGGVNASPYGQFDFGASTGGSFQGGGAPSAGIAVGASDTFTFSLTGTNLLSLTDTSFLSTLSTGTGAGQGYEDFVVRFRGFVDGGSDKVPNTSSTPVPEPASLALLGTALVGLGAVAARRWRRRGARSAG